MVKHACPGGAPVLVGPEPGWDHPFTLAASVILALAVVVVLAASVGWISGL